MRFDGRVAIVTGAGQGLGRAYAQRLAGEGACVAVAEINPTTGEATVEDIRGAGGRAVYVALDVADDASCERMAAQVVREFGRVDILVNNAAFSSVLRPKPFWEWSVDEWDACRAIREVAAPRWGRRSSWPWPARRSTAAASPCATRTSS